jgi:hypothetical protein
MKIEISVPQFPGFYASWLDINEYFECSIGYDQNSSIITPYAYDNIDYQKTYDNIGKEWLYEYCVQNSDALKDFGIELDFVTISSPKYYNFTTDQLIATAKFDGRHLKKAVLKQIANDFDRFSKIIKERHTSYDGFCSWYSNSPNEWVNNLIPNELYTDSVIFETCLIFLTMDSFDKDELNGRTCECIYEQIEYLPMEPIKDMADRYLLEVDANPELSMKEYFRKYHSDGMKLRDFKRQVKEFRQQYNVELPA